jgi:hypothetical protein
MEAMSIATPNNTKHLRKELNISEYLILYHLSWWHGSGMFNDAKLNTNHII